MSTLSKAIEERKQAAAAAGELDAMTKANRPGEAAFIEFQISPDNCVGYAASQLMHYQLVTRKPDLADDPTKPMQTLTLGLQTADLVVSGNRLNLITAALVEGTLAAVRAIPSRYAELNARQPFVAKIETKALKQNDEQN
jgi:hypothetical protein